MDGAKVHRVKWRRWRLLYAGIGIVFAPSIAPIHRQNLINNGMFPVTDPALAKRLAAQERVEVSELITSLDDLSKRVVRYGGLFRFMEARSAGTERDKPIDTPRRPMTIAEKILARAHEDGTRRRATRRRRVHPRRCRFLS